MTQREVYDWIEKRPFQPFRVVMKNGDTYDVPLQRLAKTMTGGVLLVFEPATKEWADVAGPPVPCIIDEIDEICPLEKATT